MISMSLAYFAGNHSMYIQALAQNLLVCDTSSNLYTIPEVVLHFSLHTLPMFYYVQPVEGQTECSVFIQIFPRI
jgi:hypothetical protein